MSPTEVIGIEVKQYVGDEDLKTLVPRVVGQTEEARLQKGKGTQGPAVDVDWMPIWAEAGAVAHATAIRIARANSIDYALFAEPDHERSTAERAKTAEKRSLSASSATSAVKRGRGRWRVGDIETDARMLFCRLADDGRLTRAAMVDGSLVRSGGRRGVHVALPGVVPDLHLDYRDLHVWHSGIR